MDFLVSYNWSHFSLAKPEIIASLKPFGDPDPVQSKNSSVSKYQHVGIQSTRSICSH